MTNHATSTDATVGEAAPFDAVPGVDDDAVASGLIALFVLLAEAIRRIRRRRANRRN